MPVSPSPRRRLRAALIPPALQGALLCSAPRRVAASSRPALTSGSVRRMAADGGAAGPAASRELLVVGRRGGERSPRGRGVGDSAAERCGAAFQAELGSSGRRERRCGAQPGRPPGTGGWGRGGGLGLW